MLRLEDAQLYLLSRSSRAREIVFSVSQTSSLIALMDIFYQTFLSLFPSTIVWPSCSRCQEINKQASNWALG